MSEPGGRLHPMPPKGRLKIPRQAMPEQEPAERRHTTDLETDDWSGPGGSGSVRAGV